MKHDIISIQGESYKVGFSFMAIKEYEELTGKSVAECTTTYDTLLLMFCTLRAKNKTFLLNLDQFIAFMDENPELLNDFQFTDGKEDKKKVSLMKTLGMGKTLGLWMLSILLWFAPIWIPIIFGMMLLWKIWTLVIVVFKMIGRKSA
ncbi:hypothetical protein K5X82_07395 [Halosquirtibacter xylanolyticus]|uniref:hypothetical protein n=1 Tax=Halosquirtibacter xylanolyticus TaxID=3374599 RepID=UPI003747C889|nr:hypothetical protein K5X82_07395 [Prolixibacteraceae bacterium]